MNEPQNNLRLLVGLPEKTARGGINACEPPLLRVLARSGVEVSEEIYIFDNAADVSLLRRIRQVWLAAMTFRRRLRNEAFDAVHLNSSFDRRSVLRDAFTLFALAGNSAGIFVKFHGSDLEYLKTAGFIGRALIRFVVRNAAGIGLLSTEELRGFLEFGLPREKFFVVKNALTEFGEPELPHTEKKLGHGPFKLLFVSRLIPTKGLADTISSVALLSERGFDVILNVLGDGESREPAEELASELGIAEIVRFHGHISEESVREFYHDSDLLVFPTFHCEGFPMVIFNSMKSGLPIVTTRIRAAADLLEDGVNCLFCESRNPEDIADRIATLIDDPVLSSKMGDANKNLAESFSADRVAPEYLEIYRSIASRK